MTPAARLSAAIDVLDRFLVGEAVEKALTGWARANRYAGSKDRAAVRDLVFEAVRCLRSHAALGGSMTGRGLILGGVRDRGEDPAALFTGERYAPEPLLPVEQASGHAPEGNETLDCPDWLAPMLRESLGVDFEPTMRALRCRADQFLRVNLRKCTRNEAVARLAQDGVHAVPDPLSPTALRVVEGARGIQRTEAFVEGWVELQDASSQAVADALPLASGARVLDYCAGGGGKTLAMAGRVHAHYFAHDANPRRMRDLPARAVRAGVAVTLLDDPSKVAPYDLVLCDVPCSGSGAWRRSPEGKWRLDADRLAELTEIQQSILSAAANLVAAGGVLAYVTCSLLQQENERQIERFLQDHKGWRVETARRLTLRKGGDGFYFAHLTHNM